MVSLHNLHDLPERSQGAQSDDSILLGTWLQQQMGGVSEGPASQVMCNQG